MNPPQKTDIPIIEKGRKPLPPLEDNKQKNKREEPEKYVLQKFKNDEIECVFRIYSELLNDLSIDE